MCHLKNTNLVENVNLVDKSAKLKNKEFEWKIVLFLIFLDRLIQWSSAGVQRHTRVKRS